MTKTSTNYIVQSFRKSGRKLVADPPLTRTSAAHAVESAERLVDRKAGVVAYSVVVEPDSELLGEPKILFNAGELPRELAGD